MLIAALAITATGMALAGGIAYLVQRDVVLRSVEARLTDELNSVPHSSQFSSMPVFLARANSEIPIERGESASGIVGDETLLPRTGRGGYDLTTDTALLQRIAADATREDPTKRGEAQTAVGLIRYGAVTAETSDGTRAIYVRTINVSSELEPLQRGLLTMAGLGLIMLVLMGIALWFILGSLLLSPIKQLHASSPVGGFSAGRRRVPTPGAQEVQEASRSVSAMLDRIEGAADAQRQLLDDIRHELKTPITIVRGHLEMMDPDDPSDVLAARDIGMSELDRMTRLVDDIDLLASVEDDEFTMGVVDIDVLTSRIGELVVAIPGHSWSVLSSVAGRVRGNPDRMLQAWLALADNAAKYTPAGSPIELGSSHDRDGFAIWVQDHGPGIPEAVRHRIFRRFDRGMGRRDVGGSGLGLAIVNTIARAHGGSCSVIDTPGGGATFVIHVPGTLEGTALPAPIRAGHVVQQREETQ